MPALWCPSFVDDTCTTPAEESYRPHSVGWSLRCAFKSASGRLLLCRAHDCFRPEADIAPAPTWYSQVGRRHLPVPAHGRLGNIARRAMSHLPCSEPDIGTTGRCSPISAKALVPQGISQYTLLCHNAKNVSGFGGFGPNPLASQTTSGNSGRATDNGWPGVENPIH